MRGEDTCQLGATTAADEIMLLDLWRHTFPKDLRFCRQCDILHAQLSSVSRRYRDKRTIPKAEVQMVLDGYQSVPYAWMRWPIVRTIACVRLVNAIRVYRGERAWLFTNAVKTEHEKLAAWFDKHCATRTVIDRERFVHDCLEPFHMATAYHRGFLLGLLVVIQLMVFLVACHFFERVVYVWLFYWQGYDRAGIRAWWVNVLQRHVTPELIDAYRHLVPPAVVLLTRSSTAAATGGLLAGAAGGNIVTPPAVDSTKAIAEKAPDRAQVVAMGADHNVGLDCVIGVQVAELTAPDGLTRVVFIPTPRIGPVSFYRAVGRICRSVQGVVLEEVCLESLKALPPSFYFPLASDDTNKGTRETQPVVGATFPSLGLHHRFMDLIGDDPEIQPPQIFPGTVQPTMPAAMLMGATPLALRYVLFPDMFYGTRAEARLGWGRLKEVVEAQQVTSIAMPWSVSQITNLECSLVKQGWRVTHTSVIPWLCLEEVADHFCDYYGIK